MRRNTEIKLFYLFLVFVQLFAAVRLWWDLSHPKVCEYFGDDPYVYRWAVLILWLLFPYILISVIINERKFKRKARVAMLLRQAEAFLRNNQLVEAEMCLKECKELSNYHDSTGSS